MKTLLLTLILALAACGGVEDTEADPCEAIDESALDTTVEPREERSRGTVYLRACPMPDAAEDTSALSAPHDRHLYPN